MISLFLNRRNTSNIYMDILTAEQLEFSEWKGEKPHSVQRLVPEASARKFYLLNYKNHKKILCHDVEFNTDYSHLSSWFSAHDIHVPRIFRQDEKLGLFLADYCGGTDMSMLDDTGFEKALFKAMDMILSVQKSKPDRLIAGRSFDKKKLRFELDFFVKHWGVFSAAQGIVYHITEEVYNELTIISDYLADKKDKIVAHRDFHSRNIMITEENELCLIDFQDAMMGVPQYDLVSILFDPYRPVAADRRIKYLEYYKSRYKNNENFDHVYYRAALQRMFKALGSYFMLTEVKKLEKYQKSILPALENILYILDQDEFDPVLKTFFQGMYDEVGKL